MKKYAEKLELHQRIRLMSSNKAERRRSHTPNHAQGCRNLIAGKRASIFALTAMNNRLATTIK